jgi:hypothetical protein
MAFAQLFSVKGLHAASARLWADALAADPKLAEDRRAQHRYNAACSAALAGCGQAKDDPPPDEIARAALRRQAQGWLEAERAAWAQSLETGPPQSRAAIVKALQHWRRDPDLAGIRDPEALAKLPEAERREWQALWGEVDALLKRAEGGTP